MIPGVLDPGFHDALAAGKGLTVTSADKRFQVTFRSRIQLRETYTHSESDDTNEIAVRRIDDLASLVPWGRASPLPMYVDTDFSRSNMAST